MKKVFLLMAFSAIVVSRVAAASAMGCNGATSQKSFTFVQITFDLFENYHFQGQTQEDVDSTIKVQINYEGNFRPEYTRTGVAHIVPGTTTGQRTLTVTIDGLYPGMNPGFCYALLTNGAGDTTAAANCFGTLSATSLNTKDTASIATSTLSFSGTFNGIDTGGYYQWIVSNTSHVAIYTGSINTYTKGATSVSGSIPFSSGSYPDNQYEVTLKVWNPLFPSGVNYTCQVFRVPPFLPPVMFPSNTLRLENEVETGIQELVLSPDPTEVKYFSLTGQQLDAAPEGGVCIRCSGSKCRVIKKE